MSEPPYAKRDPAFTRHSIAVAFEKARATAKGVGRKGHFYKPLQKEFRRGGFAYKQVARQQSAAIYEQRWNGCRDPSISYEVIRIRRRDGFQIGGRFVEPAEVYPRSEQWGELGWTVPDKESALCKLRELVNARKKKNRRIP